MQSYLYANYMRHGVEYIVIVFLFSYYYLVKIGLGFRLYLPMYMFMQKLQYQFSILNSTDVVFLIGKLHTHQAGSILESFVMIGESAI